MRWCQLAHTEMDRFSFSFWDISKSFPQCHRWSKHRKTLTKTLKSNVVQLYFYISFWKYTNSNIIVQYICLFSEWFSSFSDGDNFNGAPVTRSYFYRVCVCVCLRTRQNTKLHKLLAPAFGSVIKNVLVRCLQQWVRRCLGAIPGHPSSEEWGLSECMVPCWARTCCNWIICSPSVIVWAMFTLPSPPIVSRVFY